MKNLDTHLRKIELKVPHPIVFICGLGGSGKTTLAKELSSRYNNAKHFELDWYLLYSSRERALRINDALKSYDGKVVDNELDPLNWYDWRNFLKDLFHLQARGIIHINNAWNQKNGEKTDKHIINFEQKNGIIFCEGDNLLHPGVFELADFIIFIDFPKDEARKRVEKRDGHRNTPEHFIQMMFIVENFDVPYFNKYKKKADFMIQHLNN